MEIFALLGAVIAAVGVVLLLLALSTYRRARRSLTQGASAMGVILGYVGTTRGLSRPVVRFTSADGRVAQFANGVASNPPRYEVGATVPVRYDPNDPEQARIESSMGLRLLPGMLGFAGVLLVVVGAIIAIVFLIAPPPA